MESLHHTLALASFPSDPNDAPEALCEALGAVLERAEPDVKGWSVESGGGEEVAAYGTRVADGLRFSVSLVGAWDEEEPSAHITLDADVSRLPVVTQADKIMGMVAVGLCFGGGGAAGGGVFWLLADHPVVAWFVALPVGMLAILACLVAAVFLTPRSALPPVPAEVREAWLRAMEGGVDALVAEGRFVRHGGG